MGANTSAILSITGTGGQIQSLYSIADGNSRNISSNFGHLQSIRVQLESLQLDASDPSLPYNLSGATILDQFPSVNVNRDGRSLFDNYDNPYNLGASNNSLWNTHNVSAPFVVFNAHVSIRVARVTFYKAHSGDAFNDRCPKKCDVFSGTSGTGPWVLRGTANWSGAYPPTVDANQAVILSSATTAQFWRLEVSGHENAYSELSEAVFRILSAGDDGNIQAQVDQLRGEVASFSNLRIDIDDNASNIIILSNTASEIIMAINSLSDRVGNLENPPPHNVWNQ